MTDLTQKQNALLDELLRDFKCDDKDLLGQNSLIKPLTRCALEPALEREITDHLGYSLHQPCGRDSLTISAYLWAT